MSIVRVIALLVAFFIGSIAFAAGPQSADARQQVVEIVRKATGQLTDRLHLL